MKKKLLLALLLFLTLSGTVSAQEKETTDSKKVIPISFSFGSKSIIEPESLKKIKPGEYYQVVINGINQNLYKVSINHADSTLTKALEMPSFSTFPIETISTLIASINPRTTTVLKNGSGTKLSEPVGDTMAEYKIKLTGHLAILQQIRKSIDSLQLESYQYTLEQLRVKPTNKQGYNYGTALAGIIKIRNKIAEAQIKILKGQQDYLKFSEDRKDEIEEKKATVKENLKTADAEIKAAFTALVTSCSEAQATVSADKVKELMTSVVHAENNADTIYRSMPLQFTKEQAIVDITIEPRDPATYKLQTYRTSVTFPASKLSYAGVGVSFYTSKLYDEVYSLEGFAVNDSVTHYRAREESVSKREIGITALLRVGTRIKKYEWLGIHGSIGPGISIGEKVKPRLLAGGGLAIGTKHCFTLDAGVIAGYVERRSALSSPDEVFTVKPDNVTVSKLKADFFFSLGYLYRF
ncbi:hypothetical protein FMM05_20075 [Flavobacterium zepuense]|uniref:Outer membrane protein beta-barrel domain-containing protein n=1 Tax=Flavobacterium zepuense TaxID=2593302 RepID=A0A552UTM8_9FLAO|nr:hypothetical protein [Flavobacterium zepuense]TRW21557.1 hypothetical protein FMM05_20075 [Flavobacterium zepuense]